MPFTYFECLPAELPDDDSSRNALLGFPSWINTQWQLDESRPVVGWNPQIFATIHGTGPLTDLAAVLGTFHAMSARLVQLLESIGCADIQLLPFRIRTVFGGELPHQYALANYLTMLDAVDLRAAQLDGATPVRDPATGAIVNLRSLALCAEMLGDARIFRLRGASDRVIYRSDVIRRIEQSELTGFAFAPVPVSRCDGF